jgi:trans-aconitate 2-methyltransferase
MWDPEQYLRFSDERARPFFDLVHAIPIDRPRTVVDLGCGPGGMTATLLERWPDALITGVDSSPEMITHARRRAVAGRLRFVHDDVMHWRSDEPVDVMISNACFHWLADHGALLDHLLPQLTDDGVLAFQVPNNTSAPSHRLLAELLETPPWTAKLRGLMRPAIPSPEWYVERLSERGFAVDAWETRYLHILDGETSVLEWVKGTALREALDRLTRSDREAFLTAYGELLRTAYPRRPWGTMFPFTRLFIVASRSVAPPPG